MKNVKVIMSTLNESGEEKEKVIKRCKSVEEAEQFVLEHEQEFADDIECYTIDIEQ